MQRHVLSILVKNHSGVLSRITGLFSRRGYNIESLSVGPTEEADISRITIAVNGDGSTVSQIIKQVSKLVEVIRIAPLTPEGSVSRELMLIKVRTTRETRAEILEIINIFRARVIDVASESLVIETTGDLQKQEAFLGMLEQFEILEIARTGLASLARGTTQLKNEPKK